MAVASAKRAALGDLSEAATADPSEDAEELRGLEVMVTVFFGFSWLCCMALGNWL